MEIDAVVTWVDCSDQDWFNKFIENARKVGNKKSPNFRRFGNFGELELCLRSIRKFAPWIRTIFLLTDDQRPSWLSDQIMTDLGIKLVFHRDVLPSDVVKLPTFNSSVIEANLHRIPDLSENFLYFNDDTCLGRPINKSDFIADSKKFKVYVDLRSYRLVNGGADNRGDSFWRKSITRAHSLMVKEFGKSLPYMSNHQATMMNKKSCQKTWKLFEKDLKKSGKEQFRKGAKYPLNFILLSQMVGEKNGKLKIRTSGPFSTASAKVSSDSSAERNLKSISKKRPHFFCVNNLTPQSEHIFRKFVDSFLS